MRQDFEKELKVKAGKTTMLVVAHYDDTRETLKDKVTHLLKTEVGKLSAFAKSPKG